MYTAWCCTDSIMDIKWCIAVLAHCLVAGGESGTRSLKICLLVCGALCDFTSFVGFSRCPAAVTTCIDHFTPALHVIFVSHWSSASLTWLGWSLIACPPGGAAGSFHGDGTASVSSCSPSTMGSEEFSETSSVKPDEVSLGTATYRSRSSTGITRLGDRFLR